MLGMFEPPTIGYLHFRTRLRPEEILLAYVIIAPFTHCRPRGHAAEAPGHTMGQHEKSFRIDPGHATATPW